MNISDHVYSKQYVCPTVSKVKKCLTLALMTSLAAVQFMFAFQIG